MKKVLSTNNVPIKLWLDDIEDGALEQAFNLSELPFVFKHIVILPDAHRGYGMPIGGVIATKDVIIPHAVGSDIGCGMLACRTSLVDIDIETIKRIFGGSKEYQGGIRATIPVGNKGGSHSKKQDRTLMPSVQNMKESSFVWENYDKALRQIGTLGGGNHFIEIQKGSDGFIWIMIHSGSRNLGHTVAEYYNKIAIKLNEKYFSSVPKKHQLAFLPLDSKEGQNYLEEMNYCVDFALANRELMLQRIKESFLNIDNNITFEGHINIAHNYASMENHFNKNVMVHRKGATRAYENQLGIIPGSQGSNSYIVKGKGNIESFKSCSHGAGRLMSRTQAKKELDFETEKKKLDDQGIIHSLRGPSNLDESMGSYKDIDEVMNNQRGLVDIVVKLTPLAVIKG